MVRGQAIHHRRVEFAAGNCRIERYTAPAVCQLLPNLGALLVVAPEALEVVAVAMAAALPSATPSATTERW
jgi:hypothetical protein